MNKTAKIILYSIIAVLIIWGFLLYEYQKHDIDPIIKQQSLEQYGKVIYFEDFPKEKLFQNSEFEAIKDSVHPNEIGGSPEMAFVPILFDEKGILFTTKRFLALPREEQDTMDEYYLTDLETFQEITQRSEAKAEYAQISVNIHGNPFWVFDPYLAQPTVDDNQWN